MLSNNNDPFLHWLTLSIPVLIIGSGVMMLVSALFGIPAMYEKSRNPRMQEQLARWGKTKARIIHGIASLPLVAFGGWLLYCWLNGPVRH